MSNNTTPPPAISPAPTTKDTQKDAPNPSCPFCTIATNFPPYSPKNPGASEWDPERIDPPGYVILSTPDVIAFLDIAPLTRGHVLVAPRKHRVKMADLDSCAASELGRLLPLIARSVLRAALPDVDVAEADYNIVQNNGHRAAQVVPHIHFHVVPRPPDGYSTKQYSSFYADTPKYTPKQNSYIMFGRGMRTELDDEDAVVLARSMRERVLEEVERVRREEGVDLLRMCWCEGEKL
jgi:diadenosine tetraphosphate (Ap4A) HIT family hydrolase